MIHILGIKKVFLLLLLIVVAVSLFVLNTYYLAPQTNKLQKELQINEAEARDLTAKINTLANNHERFSEQKTRFDFIQQTGFFNPQQRLEVRKLITELKVRSGVTSVRFSMGAVNVETNDKAQEVNHKLLKTEVTYDVGAIEDTDIYNFLFMLSYGFPGIIEIKDVMIERPAKLTQPVLRKVGAGESVVLVKANIKTVWWTLVPSDTVEADSPTSDEAF